MAAHHLGWRAQLNPKLMMVVERRDPCPSWDCREGRERRGSGGSQAAGNNLACIIAASSNSVWMVVGGGGRMVAEWAWGTLIL